ncbi:MAG: hypothetical protein IKN88_03020, partial [Bacteroidales bacterium]|nr:hypothetical protein [Bacteroidales bacterium]
SQNGKTSHFVHSETAKPDLEKKTRSVIGQKGLRDGEVSSSAAAATLGKLLFETGYFPAKPRITYKFFLSVAGDGAGRIGGERVSSRPPAGALGGSCCRPRKTLRHPDTQKEKCPAA